MLHNEVVQRTHQAMNRARTINALVRRKKFSVLFENATPAEQERVLYLCDNIDLEGVKLWIHKHSLVELDCLGVRELRQLAVLYKVPDYHILRKEVLIQEIMDARQDPRITLEDDQACSIRSERNSSGEADSVGTDSVSSGEVVGVDFATSLRAFRQSLPE